MLEFLKKLFSSEKPDFAQLIKEGAIIVDVRSKGEYAGGHIRGSVNIPLEKLGSNVPQLKKRNKPVITCCASGMRSSSAKSILKGNGLAEVYNGGGWRSLQNKIF
ncbi:MAG: rhodanese-like domain-containing protein [Mariniphaga sp.]